MKKLLVVDDEPTLREPLAEYLTGQGFSVREAESAAAARSALLEDRPDLVLLDIMMPGEDGLSLCRHLVEAKDLPVILLTAVDEEETVVSSIEEIAEDYVIKPFNPRELAARVKRVLRRLGDFTYALAPQTVVDDHLAVDFAHQTAQIGDSSVVLTPTETKLLYILMRNAGKTVLTSLILRRVWADNEADENTLRVHVHRLRQKIEVAPSRPRYVVTERGVGYSFIPPD